jgi:CHASE2 domain-containing sensor protein/tRNA A-37 threonylcarbamoyl transferase component Bud32
MKTAFWKSDRMVGLAIVGAFLLVSAMSSWVGRMDLAAYDMGLRLTHRPPADNIAIIAIDNTSIDNIGRWPWSREVHAKMIDQLTAAGARVVVNTVFFTEPQVDAGYAYIQKLQAAYQQIMPTVPVPPVPAGEAMPAPAEPATTPLAQMGQLLNEAAVQLNTDQKLADSLTRSGRAVLPMIFEWGQPQGNPDARLPDYVQLNRVQVQGNAEDGLPVPSVKVTPPIESIARSATGLGNLNLLPDARDGAIRYEPLVVRYYDEFYPSLALVAAARSLNIDPADIKLTLGQQVRLGNITIPTDSESLMRTYFYQARDHQPPFPMTSFYDVYSGKVAADKFRDKIVIIGTTATGVGSALVTPVAAAATQPEVIAHGISSILQQHYVVSPVWGELLRLLAFVVVALYLVLALPRLRAGVAALTTTLLLAGLLGIEFGLLIGQLHWVALVAPASLLLIGHLLLTTKRYLVTERGKEKSEAESAESNRMLGLAFQGQGQLDMAFDKFRKCPLDDALLDLLYNLALDFERKRQFNKAEAVYGYMSEYNPGYRDLPQKLARSRQLSETVILGGGNSRSNSSLMMEGTIEKPMLGRYQVEKELGKGAMGVVYFGRDPKIGRTVAIKTMALSQEFENEELADARSRFFREAETAGRLNHPHIVTIYDAGEEHDLCYIAMEFLKGKDLVPHTKPGALLPLDEVVRIVADVADALGYAHQHQVVHRDIKPANMMYDPDQRVVKVTDFGIARITDSSKTKTGMVLGTPSYMSPEQLSGKKIDGRSDLFSLGVTLYQLCCGALPFQGDSMAELMFRIANEPPRDILAINPALPAALVQIIQRALSKPLEDRYQTGAELAQSLRACVIEQGGA